MVSNHKQLLQIWSVTINRISLYALLALMVEQRFCKPKVVGSSPARGSSRKLSNNILAYGINCIKLQMNE